MKLDSGFEFFELKQLDDIFVSNGRDSSSGRAVQRHQFPADKAAEASRIAQRLIELPEDARAKIIKFGQEGGLSYFLTEPLPEGMSIKSWISFLLGTPAAPTPRTNGPDSGKFQELYTNLEALPTGETPGNAAPVSTASKPGSRPGSFSALYSPEDLSKLADDVPEASPRPSAISSAQETGGAGKIGPSLDSFVFKPASPEPKPATPEPKPFIQPPPMVVIERPLRKPEPPASSPPAEPFRFQDPIGNRPQPEPEPPRLRPVLPVRRAAPAEPIARPRGRSFDLKVALLVLAVLLAIAAAVIAIAG